MKTFSTLLFSIVLCTAIAVAQQPPSKLLRVSPYASISQTIGITEVSVSYHRPGVKEREIWNKLVPYNQIWRAGANNATVFSFSDDVNINGTTLKAGKYSFFTIPAEGAWTVIFNSHADQWGAYYYDSTKNVLTFSVTPEQAPHEEWLSYNFSELGLSSAKMTLRWEKLAVSFVINTSTMENVSKLEASFKSQAATQAAQAARYALDSKSDFEAGLQAIERAIALNPVWGNYSVKAQLFAAQEKYADAVKTGELAIETAKKAKANFGPFEGMVNEWKVKLPPVKGKKK
jgi:tetratricopeptide (TPR) repeat protein